MIPYERVGLFCICLLICAVLMFLYRQINVLHACIDYLEDQRKRHAGEIIWLQLQVKRLQDEHIRIEAEKNILSVRGGIYDPALVMSRRGGKTPE